MTQPTDKRLVTEANLPAYISTAGATQTALDNRFAKKSTQTVNVKDAPYGALGNGSTNDSNAIHSARDAAGVGGTLRFPPGTYRVASLTANVASQTWIFDPGAVLKLVDSSDSHVVNVSADGISLIRPTVDGNKAFPPPTGHSGINLSLVSHCVVEGATVTGAKDNGIALRHTNNCRVSESLVIDSGLQGIFLYAQSTEAADAMGNIIERCEVDRTGISASTITEGGIEVSANGTRKVLRTRIANNVVRLPMSPTADSNICIEIWGGCPSSVIIGNATFGGYMGISADRSDLTSITGNTITSPSWAGIELPNTKHCSITGNTIDGSGIALHGVMLDGGTGPSNNCVISGNVVRNTTTTAVAAFTAASNNAAIAGNYLHCLGTGSSPVVVSITSCDGWTVTGNQIDGGGAAQGVNIRNSSGATINANYLNNLGTYNFQVLADQSGYTCDTISFTGNMPQALKTFIQYTATGGGIVGSNISQTANAQRSLDMAGQNNSRVLCSNQAPEGVWGAGIGSIYMRFGSGQVGAQTYIKEAGTAGSSTGWRAVQAIRTKAGIPVDTDWTTAPADGVQVLDTTNGRLYTRVGGVWKFATLT